MTVIDVLSPTNKDGRRGQSQYLEKRAAYMGADTSFVEIGLQRALADCYRDGQYWNRVNYREARLVPPPDEALARWMKTTLAGGDEP